MTADAHEVSQRLAAKIDRLVRDVLPSGRIQGNDWRVGSLGSESGNSLAIALEGAKQGLWIDHATGEKGDALDLVKGAFGYNTREALNWSRRWLDRRGGEAPRPSKNAGIGDDKARRIEWALALWGESDDPQDTLVDTYLRRRLLKLRDPVAGNVIRYHPKCPWTDRDSGKTVYVPAMIAAMRSIATNKITGIHRTRLSPQGKKIDRRMLGVAAGAAVKLDADEMVTDRLHIGEGIETAMTAQQLKLGPVWALGAAGGIKMFPVLEGVQKLTILAEHDEANKTAREACGLRWHQAGREVEMNIPDWGKDLNDALQRDADDRRRGRR